MDERGPAAARTELEGVHLTSGSLSGLQASTETASNGRDSEREIVRASDSGQTPADWLNRAG